MIAVGVIHHTYGYKCFSLYYGLPKNSATDCLLQHWNGHGNGAIEGHHLLCCSTYCIVVVLDCPAGVAINISTDQDQTFTNGEHHCAQHRPRRPERDPLRYVGSLSHCNNGHPACTLSTSSIPHSRQRPSQADDERKQGNDYSTHASHSSRKHAPHPLDTKKTLKTCFTARKP